MTSSRRQRWQIEYSRLAERQLSNRLIVHINERGRLRDEIETQLRYEPDREHGHRFRMEPNPTAAWELWVDPLRVYYDLFEDEHVVYVQAIGRKQGNAVYFGGEEVVLRE